MYGLDKEVDLSPMVNKSIEQICVGQYQVTVNLSDRISISIEAAFKIRNPHGDVHEVQPNQPETSQGLLSIIGEKVITATLRPPGGVDILLSDGSGLLISDSNREFESYTIDISGETIVV